MEEILASIRRIISEDEAPPEAEAAAPSGAVPEPEPEPVAAAAPPAPEPEPEPASFAPEPEPQPEPVHVQAEEDDVLELTQKVEPAAETHGDIEVYAAPEPAAARAPEPSPPGREEEPLLGDVATSTVASAFGHLHQTIAMPRDGLTLEDVVKDLLRPLLKTWLDEHLPEIVQAKVEAEVERAARGRTR